MYSTVFLLLFAAFYLFYNLSARIKITDKPTFLTYLTQRPRLSRQIGLGLVIVAFAVLITQLGVGAGIFGLIVALMGVGSLIVILTPFRYFRLIYLLLIYGCIVVFEVLIF